jgi:colicin import membrane protein
MSTQLATIDEIKLPATFAAQEVTDVLSAIKRVVTEQAADLDISTRRGREDIASLARKVGTTKQAMIKLAEDRRRNLRAKIEDEVAGILIEDKRIKAELDELRDTVRAPLTRWENAEKERVAGHESTISAIELLAKFDYEPAAADIEKLLAHLDAMPPRKWEEFEDRATKVISVTREDLQHRLARRQKADADAAELAWLQREDAERRERDRLATVARIAAEQAQREERERAEAARVAEAERVERERLAEQRRVEARERELHQAAQQAERQLQQAELDRMAAENAARVAEERRVAAAEQAERDRKAAEAKAEQERLEAAERAQRQQEAALAAERERVAKIARDEEAARQKREADKAHRGRINGAARDALAAVIRSDLLTHEQVEQMATALVVAIAKGEIPHVTISY